MVKQPTTLSACYEHAKNSLAAVTRLYRSTDESALRLARMRWEQAVKWAVECEPKAPPLDRIREIGRFCGYAEGDVAFRYLSALDCDFDKKLADLERSVESSTSAEAIAEHLRVLGGNYMSACDRIMKLEMEVTRLRKIIDPSAK